MQFWALSLIAIGLGVVLGYFLSQQILKRQEGFQNSIQAYKSDPEYKKQLKSIVDRFDPISSKRRDYTDMLGSSDIPEVEQALVNFQVLSCRFTGYLGPFKNGYFDADQATLYALKAGCRSFILEIDYLESCADSGDYYPKLVVRDVQGKIMSKSESTQPMCDSDSSSSIRHVCQVLRDIAFSTQVQNAKDPLIIVLYLLRLPPREKTGNKRLLTYYSRIAKGLEPLLDKITDSTINGGTFARQQQESLLLTNHIKDYEGRVLIFCNSDTSGFRTATGIPQNEDLDYLVNLRLTYKQTQLGCTSSQSGGSFGGIETVESMLVVPPSQVDNTCDELKLRWTVCLSQDPSVPVNQKNFEALSQQFGVHCTPIQLWDSTNTFMFGDATFGKWSFVPKPKDLRYRRLPIAVPAEQTPATDAKGGKLRSPTIGQ